MFATHKFTSLSFFKTKTLNVCFNIFFSSAFVREYSKRIGWNGRTLPQRVKSHQLMYHKEGNPSIASMAFLFSDPFIVPKQIVGERRRGCCITKRSKRQKKNRSSTQNRWEKLREIKAHTHIEDSIQRMARAKY